MGRFHHISLGQLSFFTSPSQRLERVSLFQEVSFNYRVQEVCCLFVLQNKVKDEAPKGGEVDVELSIGGRVGDEEDDNEDDGVGVRDDEPVGNVLGKHLDQGVRLDWL